MPDKYMSFAELALSEERGKDYEIDIRLHPVSRVAVIAPHGGGIEPETSRIAELISRAGFSFYSFRGLKPKGNSYLHITSHRFDEPECLSFLQRHDRVVAIHGCRKSGDSVYLGGLDSVLIKQLAEALALVGIATETTNHPYMGEHKQNICNRGARGIGVQFELTLSFRQGRKVSLFVRAVQDVLTASGRDVRR